ncbi:MAG: ornithine cyclodeaminase family protein [Rubrivivax sp.]|nr:ornithine cyclodeaminase family protein [Rubrivivax sp.]
MTNSSPNDPHAHQRRHDADATLVLTGADIAQLMRPADDLACAREAFAALAEGRAVAPAPLHLAGEGGGLHAKGASLHLADGTLVLAVKVNANFPGNPRLGLPTIQGAVLLFDGGNGRLLAILDSIEVTRRRTAAATALAARHLARRDARTLAIVGCGDQARPHLQGLLAVTPARRVRVFDLHAGLAAALAREAGRVEGVEASAERDLAAAVRDADLVVCCTTARRAFLDVPHVAPGAFVAAVGADAPDKSELSPALMARAKVVVDVRAQCAAMGDLHHAIAAGAMAEHDVFASLGEVVAGHRPGRENADDIIVFDSTGTGVQDVAACAAVHRRATAAGLGSSLRLQAGPGSER